jgi:hypothetical protein
VDLDNARETWQYGQDPSPKMDQGEKARPLP